MNTCRHTGRIGPRLTAVCFGSCGGKKSTLGTCQLSSVLMGNVNCRRWNKTAINYSFPWFLLFFVSVSECIFIPRQCARGQLRMQQGHWTRHTFEGDSPHRGAPCATSLIFCGFSLGAFHRLQFTLLKRTELSWHVPNVHFFPSKNSSKKNSMQWKMQLQLTKAYPGLSRLIPA